MAANSRMFYVFAFVFMGLSCWFPSNADLQPADLLSEAKSLDTADTSAIEYVLQVRRNATATQKKLSGDLMVKSASLHMSLTSTPSRVMRNSLQTITKDEIADVNIKCITSDRLVARIKELGGEVISRSDRFGSIHARVPISRLEMLAADTDVKKVKTVVKPMLNKANVSEGVVSHRVAQVFSAYDITGRGVKVGVISDSSRYLSDVQASGDLPNDVIVLPGLGGARYIDGERDDTGEGTAMMEIVHDLAPGAQLYFATAGHTEEEMAESILALKAAGCSIIVDDICFYSEAVFQDGIVARTVNAVAEEGCIYVTCAANMGNLDSGKSGVWEGDFSPGGTTVSLDDETWEAHQFAYGSEVAKWNPLNGALTQAYGAYGMPLRIDLQWSDPLDGACNDYAIGLYDTESRTLIGWSVDVQDGDDDPHDSVLIYPEITTKYPYLGIAIFKKAGAASRHLHLSVFQQAYDDSPGWFLIGTDGHVYGHNAAESAISVGAAKQVSGRAFNSADTADYYSSDGPRRMFYREDGTPYTSSLLSDGGIVLNKPDVTAASTVSCATSGFNPFPGTSAAAPHVAAIVALMLEANPELSLPDIRSILAVSTHSTGGWNRTMGYGIVDAYWAVEEARYYGLPRMVTPTLTSGQIFFGGLAVTATSSDSGATLRYTADGSEPNEGSAQWPSEGLVLSSSATVTVRAFKDGYRPSRAVSAIYTKGNVPSAPTVSLSGTTLSWTAPSGANYYRVYRSTNPYSEPLPYSGWITGLSYTVAQPSSEGTVYFYTVKAAATADEATASPFSDTGKALVYSAYTEVHMYGASSFSVTPVLNSSEVFQNMKFHVTSGSSSAITGTISGPNGTQDIATSPTIGASSGSLVIARYTFAVSGTANSSTMPCSYGFYTTYSVPSGWSNSSGKSYAQAVWLAHPHYYYQAGATAFSIGQTSQSVEAEGGAFSTTVSATPLATTWSVEASGDWIVPYRTSQSGSATLGYFVAPNTSSQERTGTLTFTQGSTTKTLTVTQAGTTPAVLPNLYPYRPQGWSAPLVVAASPENSTNSTATTFLTTDDLYASLALACSGASATERLIAALYVDGTRKHRWSWDNGIAMGHYGYTVGYSLGTLSAGTHTVELVCDSENAIAESDESDNTYSITVTVVDGDPGPDNPDPEEPELRLEGYYHDFDASGGETAFTVVCDGAWMAYPTVEWITITYNENGHGNGTVGFAVSANTSTSPRTGSIVVTCGTVSQTWEITQEGASVSLDIRTEIVDGIEWSYIISNGVSVVYNSDGEFSQPAISTSTVGDIAVPSFLGGYQVIGIGDYAFFGCGIQSVTIPDGVANIGKSAFDSCSFLERVSFPDSVTSIGANAFNCCFDLRSVAIPSGVTRIERFTFNFCDSLQDVTIPSGVTVIEEDAFSYCTALTSMTIPASVERIGNVAFFSCRSLAEIVFLGEAPQIGGSWTFYGVPSSCVVHVRRGSTGWGVDIPGTWHGMHIEYLDDEPGEPEFTIEDGVLVAVKLNGTTDVVIPDGVTAIAEGVFSGLGEIRSVYLPASLTDIGEYAFNSCENLREVSGGVGLRHVGYDAFGFTPFLEGEEEEPAFELVRIGTFVIGYRGGDALLQEHWDSYDEETGISDWSYELDLSGASGIADGSFCSMPFTSVRFSDDLLAVGDTAFSACWLLKYVEGLPETADVSETAFGDTPYVDGWETLQLVIEDNVVIGLGYVIGYTDEGVISESGELTIPEGVTEIGLGAFSDWWSIIRAVNLPQSLAAIGDYAFQGCSYLTAVTGLSDAIDVGVLAFAGTPFNETLPFGFDIEDKVLVGFHGVCPKNIVIPDGVVEIDRFAFSPMLYGYCREKEEDDADGFTLSFRSTMTNLVSVAIPESVVHIGEGAFEFCNNLKSVTIRGALYDYTMNVYGDADQEAEWSTPRDLVTYVTEKWTGPAEQWLGRGVSLVAAPVSFVAAPIISPSDGSTFGGETCMVTISCATEGAVIYYSPRGVTPRLTDAYKYTGPFTITDTATIKAIAVLEGVKSEYMTATITKRTLTLADATSASLQFTTGGDSDWMPIGDATAATGLSAQSGVIGDEAETWMQTSVSGAGTFSFRWKVDCEWDDSGDMTWDHVAVFTNGVEAARMDGTSGWEDMSFVFADAGTHTVRWTFVKDDYDEEDADSADCAWVSGVTYTPSGPVDAVVTVGGREVTVPRTWLAAHENIVRNSGGDVTAALLATAANGRLSNVECYVLGLDPEVATNDFKIVLFPMKADGTPDIDNIVFEPPQAQWNVPATWKVKGAATLEGPWDEVSDDGGAGRAALPLRFFKVEVVLP